MKIKIEHENILPSLGVYLTDVANVRYVKDSSGENVVNKNGGLGYEIDFKPEDNDIYTDVFWDDDNSIWRLRKFLKSIEIDTSEGAVNASEAIGKQFYLIIGEKRNKGEEFGEGYIIDYCKDEPEVVFEDLVSYNEELTEIKVDEQEEDF